MSKEIELLQRILGIEPKFLGGRFIAEIQALLAQPEHKADRRSDPISKLRNLRDIQGRKGNYDVDEYMRGLYNGLELSLSIFEDRSPDYKEPIAQPEIRELLTQKREPLGEEESYHEAKRLYEAEDGLWYEDGFVDGLKFAEKMHGIGGGE